MGAGGHCSTMGRVTRPEQKEDNERGRWLEGKRGFKDLQGPGG